MTRKQDSDSGRSFRASEECYRMLAEGSSDYIFVLNSDLVYEYLNQSAAAVMGRSVEEVIGCAWTDFFPGDEYTEQMAVIRQVFATGEQALFENEVYIPQNEKHVWLSTSLAPVRDDAGRTVAVIGVSRDITEMKLAQLALAESEARYRLLAEAAQDFIFIIDTDGVINYVNEHGAKMFGLTTEDITGRKMADLFPDEIAARQSESLRAVMQTGQPLYAENYVVMPMGDMWLGTLLSPVRDDSGDITGVLGIARNITAKKQIENDLVAERDFSSQAINSMPGIFYLFDEDGRMIRWNRYLEEITGYSSDEIAAMNPLDFFDGQDRELIAARIQEVFVKGESDAEADFISKDGTRTRFYFTGYRMEAEGDPFLVGVGTNIEELRLAESQLLERDERLRLALEGTGDSIWDWDVRTGAIAFDEHWQRHLGYVPGEVIFNYDWWEENVHPQSRPVFEKALADYLSGARPAYELEYRMRRKDGQWIWVWAIGKCVEWDSERQPLRFIGTHRDITNRKDLERSVIAERDRAQEYLDIAPALMLVLNTDGTVRIINQKGCEVLGYEAADVIGKDWFEEFLPEDIRSRVREVFSSLVSGDVEPVEYFENNVITSEGTRRMIAWHNKLMRNREGKITGILSSGEDITERRAAENMLRESEQRFKALFDTAITGILLADLEKKRFVLSNDTICAMLGYSHDELAHLSVDDIHPPEALPQVVEQFERQARGELKVARDLPVMRKDGSIFYADISSAPVVLSGVTYLMGYFSDATDRHKTEAALLESEERYTSLFEESNDVVFISTPDGRFVDINPAGVRLFGYQSREELLHADTGEELFLDSGERSRFQAELELHGAVRSYQLRLRQKGGDEIIVSVTANVIRRADGSITGYRGIMRDITANQRLERQLIQAQKMESIGNLAGGVAHDFNNYLTAIQGYADLALLEQPEDGVLQEYLNEIRSSSGRAADLTRQLLLFSRREQADLRPVDLAATISDLQKMLGRLIGERFTLVTRISGSLAPVRADKGLVEQVIVNLVVNSRDAMAEGGEIIIEAGNVVLDDDAPFLAAENLDGGEYVFLKVRDDGSGIDQDTLRHIFEPFFTTKEAGRGTGLGLSVVYGIVKQHNGAIDVESETGAGTAFSIYLPVSRQEDVERRTSPAVGRISYGLGKKVLLVEDDDAVRSLASRMLEDCGFAVTVAENAGRAEELYDAAPGGFDVIFSDVILPDGSGMELAERIRARNADVAVMLASGYTGDYLDRATIESKGFRFLQKPYSLDELVRVMGELVEN